MKKINAKAFPILCNFYNLQTYFNKKYSFPSQQKIIQLINMKYGVEISIATLNRWLKEMEKRGLIKRKRRIRRSEVYGMMFKSTLYTIGRKGYIILRNAGILALAEVKKFVKAPKNQYEKAQELISAMFKKGDMTFNEFQSKCHT
jgi:DNA-binding transcriptional regulator YhcF (GntR family)